MPHEHALHVVKPSLRDYLNKPVLFRRSSGLLYWLCMLIMTHRSSSVEHVSEIMHCTDSMWIIWPVYTWSSLWSQSTSGSSRACLMPDCHCGVISDASQMTLKDFLLVTWNDVGKTHTVLYTCPEYNGTALFLTSCLCKTRPTLIWNSVVKKLKLLKSVFGN